MRLNKEIKLDCCSNINLKYGTVNKNNPQIIYLSGKMWLCPTYEGDFSFPINSLYTKFKKKLFNILRQNEFFSSNFILDFDINPDNLICNKKKFFSISIFLKQSKGEVKKLDNVKPFITSDLIYLFMDLENELIENDFCVSKRK